MKKLMIALIALGILVNAKVQAAMRPQVSCEMKWDISGKDDGSHIITGHGASQGYIHGNPKAHIRADDGRGNPNWGDVTLDDNGSDVVNVKISTAGFYENIQIDHEQDLVLNNGANTTLKCHIFRIKDVKNAYDNLAKTAQAVEPEPYKLQKSSKSLNHWMLGSSTFPYANVVTETHEVKVGSGFGVTEQDVILNTNFVNFVGYEVISNWHDGTNGNWSTDERCIGNVRCIIELRSKQFRGMNYTVKLFWIPSFDFAQDWRFNIIEHP